MKFFWLRCGRLDDGTELGPLDGFEGCAEWGEDISSSGGRGASGGGGAADPGGGGAAAAGGGAAGGGGGAAVPPGGGGAALPGCGGACGAELLSLDVASLFSLLVPLLRWDVSPLIEGMVVVTLKR